MAFEKREYRKFSKKNYPKYMLAADVGGTNTVIGLFGVKNKLPILLLSFHFNSQELRAFHNALSEALLYLKKNYQIIPRSASMAVAGVVSANKDYADVTNAPWNVDKKVLLKNTTLKKIIILNDFEAVGYGINMLNKKDTVLIKNGEKFPKAPVVVIGAGTGLGKTTLIYNEQIKSYAPIASEAGHTDFTAQSKEELELVEFIKRHRKIKQSVSYEQVLSGQGLSNIYLFLKKEKRAKDTKYTKEIDKSGNNPELISRCRKIDGTCKAAFEMFVKNYAVFARNSALDSLAYGGVYIAGGIAQKNVDIFGKSFAKEFEQNYKLSHVLKRIPIYIVMNTNIGLIGAAAAALKYL